MKKKGFSLIELIISCFIFVGLSILVFTFFRYGTRSFQTANQKHGLQTDALRTVESLKTELSRSARSSIDLLGEDDPSRSISVEGQSVRRDVISMAALKKWQDFTSSENYDLESAAPKWNRYLIFYATKAEIGQIIRVKLDPTPPPEAPRRILSSDLDATINDDPNLNRYAGEVPSYVALARNVHEFKITPDGGGFSVSLKLKERHITEAIEPGARRPYDFYELKLTVTPGNTYPNDLTTE